MSAVTRIRTWVIAATTQCTNHYKITAVIPAYVKWTVELKNGFRVKNKKQNKTNKQTNKQTKKPNNNNNEGSKEQQQEKQTKKQNNKW